MSAGRPRRMVLASVGLVAVALVAVLVVSAPFGSSPKRSGVADNGAPTSLATVTRRTLSSQMQVSATLGYAGAWNIRVPGGMAPAAVQQAQRSLSAGEAMLLRAKSSLSADEGTLANLQARVLAARQKESVDCAGDSSAESAPSSSSPSGEAASAGSPASGGSSGQCASDVQALAGAEQGSSGGAMKLANDRQALTSAQAPLAGADEALRTARSSAADYGQGATFTALPQVGQTISRGQRLLAIDGQPTTLMYGSVLPRRAFLAGMSAGGDVAELNANLDAMGYASGASGNTFGSATEAAIRAFQSAHHMAVTGELPLGSVVFERGPVLVASVTPEVGASVTPAPVLGVTSTVAQVSIALSAAQQSGVKVGDPVSITLPNNQTTPGVVSSVGTVAKTPAKGGEGGGGGGGGGEPGEEGATVEVDVTVSDPHATGHLDQAPVTVSITSASVANTLAVPIDALLALAGGGYALEVDAGGAHHLEAVTLGLFDDAEGLVQVSGPNVSAGQRVVVPSP